MFAINFGYLLALTLSIQHTRSIPFGDDLFNNNDEKLNSDLLDLSSFSSDASTDLPQDHSDTLTFNTNDAAINDALSDASSTNNDLLDYFPSSSDNNIDWTSYLADDSALSTNDNNNILLADTGASCPLSKRDSQDGASCRTTPAPNLQLPDLFGTFLGIDGTGDGGVLNPGQTGSGANADTGSLGQPDPCLLLRASRSYLHVCCDGPPSAPDSINPSFYSRIDGCVLGSLLSPEKPSNPV